MPMSQYVITSDLEAIAKRSKMKLKCSLVKLNKQGYDENGVYFGVNTGDQRLYVIADDKGYPLTHKRASSRQDALESYKIDMFLFLGE